MVQERV